MIQQYIKTPVTLGIVAIAAAISMSSCLNDNNASGADNPTPVITDSASMAGNEASSSTATKKAAARVRKGKVSASFGAGEISTVSKDKAGVYSKAEQMPQYPGGEAALSKFVENNINYPQDALDQDAEGTVMVSFVIDEKGKVVQPEASGKMTGNGLGQEAIKVVSRMPAWKPGMVKGKAVKTRLTLPVTFKLSDT
jgi:periplasmic protein TonB